MTYTLPSPPEPAAVIAAALELVERGQAAGADRLIEHAVHGGTRPIDLVTAAMALGAERERARRDGADALAAKARRLADAEPPAP